MFIIYIPLTGDLLAVDMPGDGAVWADGVSYWGKQLSQAVLNGTIPIDRLNDQVSKYIHSHPLQQSRHTETNTDT